MSGLGRDQAQYARLQLDAVFTEALSATGFDDLVGILRFDPRCTLPA